MELKTTSGLCFTILLFLIMASFALQKSYLMIIKKYIDVKTTLNYNYLSSTYVFDAEKGLDLAVAFTAYDNV